MVEMAEDVEKWLGRLQKPNHGLRTLREVLSCSLPKSPLVRHEQVEWTRIDLTQPLGISTCAEADHYVISSDCVPVRHAVEESMRVDRYKRLLGCFAGPEELRELIVISRDNVDGRSDFLTKFPEEFRILPCGFDEII